MAYLACEDVNDLIFACLSPLMVALVAAQLYADAITFEWTLRRAPSTRTEGAEPKRILRRVLKAHLVLVLFLQCAMIVFFFVDNEVRGWQMVAGVVPAVFVPRRLDLSTSTKIR